MFVLDSFIEEELQFSQLKFYAMKEFASLLSRDLIAAKKNLFNGCLESYRQWTQFIKWESIV